MGLELDEIIYGWFLRYSKKKRLNDAEMLSRQVVLEDIQPRLTLLARALCGEAIDIYPAEREGGYKDYNFFLPIHFSALPTPEGNYQYYIFRIVYLSIQRQMSLNWTDEDPEDYELSLTKASETAPQVLKRLFEEYPVLEDWYMDAVVNMPLQKDKQTRDLSWLYGKWMKNTGESSEKEKLKNFDERRKELLESEDPETVLKAKAVEEIKSLTIDKQQQEDYVLLHNFEKVETAEEFSGQWRDFDGKDELEEHQEALEEMGMKFTVRVDDPVHSVYQTDFVENTSVAESASLEIEKPHLKYDEWDYKKRIYRKDYCNVFPEFQKETNAEYYQHTLEKYKVTLNGLRKMLASVNNKWQQQKRQFQGDGFDLDALTDLYSDIHSKVSPDERIYFSQRKKEKDIAILLLLDISLSSDSYAAGNRIIDVEKEVSILFGEILNEFDIQFSIDCFNSKTRNYTSYITLKDFKENWDTAKLKVGTIQPVGYTRIGPALRHAGERIDRTDARNKWIILLSDGKPNDYDKYEGQHGIQDIKQALRELNERQINSYALAIEAQAKYYLPLMFGKNHYQILTSPVALLKSMAKLYERIKHQ